jgi:hypothetical protein
MRVSCTQRTQTIGRKAEAIHQRKEVIDHPGKPRIHDKGAPVSAIVDQVTVEYPARESSDANVLTSLDN